MLKIAVVDDEPKILNGILFMLRELYTDRAIAQGFSNAQELLALEERIDILITDICMPEIDGIQLGNVIKQKYPDSKIIIISGYEDFDYARRAIQLQVSEYLLKPVDRQQLKEVLNHLIESIEEETAVYDSRESTRAKKERLLYRIMLQGDSEAKELLKKYYKTLKLDYYICVLECGSGPQEKDTFDIRNWIKKRLEKLGNDYEIIHILDSRLAVVIYDKTYMQELVFRAWIDELQESGQSLSIGISTVADTIQDFCLCYRQAFIALKTELYEKSREFYMFRQEQGLDIDLERFVLKLLHHLVNSDAAVFIALFRELFELIKKEQPSIYVLKAVLEKIIGDLRYLLEKVDVVSDKYAVLEHRIILVDQYRSILQVENDLFQFLMIILDEVGQIKKLRTEQSIQLAIGYINENFKKDISLDEVSDRIHLTPSYFSSYFKKHTGYNFVDYITKKRIEEAKKYLKTRDFKIGDIANEVGFKEARYFAKIFRNQVGVTPSQYREIILEMNCGEEAQKAAQK